MTESLKCPHIVIDKFCLKNFYEDIQKKTDRKGDFIINIFKKLFEEKDAILDWNEIIEQKIWLNNI